MGVVTWVRYDLQEVMSDDSMRRALAEQTGPAASRFEQIDANTVVARGRYNTGKVDWYQRFVDGVPQPEGPTQLLCPQDGHELHFEQHSGRVWRYCPGCDSRYPLTMSR